MTSIKITLKYRLVRDAQTGRTRNLVGGLKLEMPYGISYISYAGLCDDVLMEVDTFEDLRELLRNKEQLYAAIEHVKCNTPVVWFSRDRANCIGDSNAVCLPIAVRGCDNVTAIKRLDDFEDETATCTGVAGFPVEFMTSR